MKIDPKIMLKVGLGKARASLARLSLLKKVLNSHGGVIKYFYIFLLRLLLSFIMAYIINLLFFNRINLLKVSLLAGIMLVLAYMFEKTRKRDRGEVDGR